jgi:hypothetical protein
MHELTIFGGAVAAWVVVPLVSLDRGFFLRGVL